uniref:ARAD1C29568p n=1 Tax=Blastobotrys adeninivorans TaxID=409370 RepID=A0A060T353_BLAAD
MSVWTKKDVRTRIISSTGRDGGPEKVEDDRNVKGEQEHVTKETKETNSKSETSVMNDTTVTSDDKQERANDTPVKEEVRDSTSETSAEPGNHDEIDPVILSALFDVRNRMFVLRLEQSMCNFIKSSQTEMDLDPMNSFYRLVAHKVADYYGLGHLSNNDAASVTLFKEKEVRLPSVRLGNIRPPVKSQDGESGSEGTSQVPSSPSSGQATPTTRRRPKLLTKGQIVEGLAAMRISQDQAPASSEASTRPSLERPSPTRPSLPSQSRQPPQLPQASSSNSNSKSKSNNQPNSEPNSQSLESAPKGLGSFEQRVAAYMEARARIFEGFEQQDDSQVDQDQQPTQRSQMDEWDPEYSRDAFVRPATVPAQAPPYQSHIQYQAQFQPQFQPQYPNQYQPQFQFPQYNQQYDQYRQHYNYVPYPPGPPGTPGAPYPPMHFNNPGSRPKHSQYDNEEPS